MGNPEPCFSCGGDTLDDMRQRTAAYVLRHGTCITSLRGALSEEWPLPVGSESLREWVQRRLSWDRWLIDAGTYDLEELRDVSEGFPPDAYVGVVKDCSLNRGHVRLFGMIESRGDDVWVFSEPVVQTTILPGGQREVRRAEQGLRAWYVETTRGVSIGWGGRPKGSGSDGPTEDERAAYAQAFAELAPTDRGPSALATRMAHTLNRSITPGWVHYWMGKGAFVRDEQAPRRTRRKAESGLSE